MGGTVVTRSVIMNSVQKQYGNNRQTLTATATGVTANASSVKMQRLRLTMGCGG